MGSGEDHAVSDTGCKDHTKIFLLEISRMTAVQLAKLDLLTVLMVVKSFSESNYL